MNELVNVVEGYVIIAIFSFVGAVASSFFTWLNLSQSEGGAPGDGFGFMVILAIVIPIWLVLAIISPFFVRQHFIGNKASIKRLLFCALTPPLIATFAAGFITLFYLN
jgi:hypothetical protein